MLSHCTVEQALADYAVVIQKLRSIYGQVPVVAVGGSYGGMLAAWFRLKYPASVNGAYISVGADLGSASDETAPEWRGHRHS